MTLLSGQAALDATGTLDTHSAVFQKVANDEKCVIASRAVGKYATGLLRDGYATKGFHNKAKSCNWGPMAGFVLTDPRFTKRGDSRSAMESQRKDLFKAFKGGAGEMPIYITGTRRADLLVPPLSAMREGWRVDFKNHYYFATSPSGKLFLFHLSMVDDAPGAYGKPLWAVQYAYTESALPKDLQGMTSSQGLEFLPVTAVVDTATKQSAKGTYLGATTGDYDLFAVFPKRSGYDRGGKDKRPVPDSDRFKKSIKEFIKHEDPHLGNLTPRIQRIMDQVNRAASHPGGNIVHHSDEAGRPMIDDIDFPFIAWVPRKRAPYLVRNVAEFKKFVSLLNFEYTMVLNPGWFKDLGFGVSGGGSYEV